MNVAQGVGNHNVPVDFVLFGGCSQDVLRGKTYEQYKLGWT